MSTDVYTCGACGEVVIPGPVPHANVCRRFRCVRCDVLFAILPEPLKKRFGTAPLCFGCFGLPPRAP